MISEAAIEAALRTSARRFNLGGTWFSNGHFALRHEVRAKQADDKKPTWTTADWLALPRQSVLEAVELRIERRDRLVDCECECGDEHKREECDDTGQMVFVANGGSTVVNPLLGHLLDGLTVFRDASPDCSPAIAMLMGFDGGELVVTAMPLRKDVRKPGAVKAVAR